MTLMVTGATGFVGAAVLRALVAAGHRVRALVRPSSDRRNLNGIDCEIVIGDLLDVATLRPALRGSEGLFHAAADYRLWVPDPDNMHRINVQGTVDLFRAAAAAGVSRIVYTSSVATLRLKEDGSSADERSHAEFSDMIGIYKQSKFLAEREVNRLVRETGMPVVTVKPTTPFGPGDIRPTPTGRMVVEAASGRMPAYINTGLNVVHVDDVAIGHLLAFDRGVVGQSYILGGENRTLKWILQTIAELTGGPSPRIRLPHWLLLPVAYACEGTAGLCRSGEPLITVDGIRMARKLMYFSSDKAGRELGYSPRPAIEALHDSVQWFSSHDYIKTRSRSRAKDESPGPFA